MNIIEKVREILTDCPLMEEFTNGIHIDFTDPEPNNFGLSSTGDKLIKEDLLGNQIRQHSFVLYAIHQSINDYDRLSNSTFLLNLAYWLEGVKDREVVAAAGGREYEGVLLSLSSANAMLYNIPTGNISDGVTYQIQIYAKYEIEMEE